MNSPKKARRASVKKAAGVVEDVLGDGDLSEFLEEAVRARVDGPSGLAPPDLDAVMADKGVRASLRSVVEAIVGYRYRGRP